MNEDQEKFLKYVQEMQLINEKYLKGNTEISAMLLITRSGAKGFSIISNVCPSCLINAYLHEMLEHVKMHHHNKEEEETLEDMEVSKKEH